MFRKNKIFKGMSRLINVISGGEETPSSPSSSSYDLQNGDPSEKVNTDKVNTNQVDNVRDNSETLARIAAQSHHEDKAEVNAGVKAFSKKEYDEAIVHYKKAVAINPSDGSVYNNIGNVYLRGKNDPETALQYYVQATTIEPSFNYGWLNLALCQKQLEDLPGAIATVSNGLKALNSENSLYGVLTQLQSQLEQQLKESSSAEN